MSDAGQKSAAPFNMDGLRELYFKEFCPLYNYLCSKLESLPSELHFEVAAAFDHLMRAGLEIDGVKYEAENIYKASGHLKRATFDAFKLLYKYTTRPLWKKLTRSRYESVPGFVEDVHAKWMVANRGGARAGTVFARRFPRPMVGGVRRVEEASRHHPVAGRHARFGQGQACTSQIRPFVDIRFHCHDGVRRGGHVHSPLD